MTRVIIKGHPHNFNMGLIETTATVIIVLVFYSRRSKMFNKPKHNEIITSKILERKVIYLAILLNSKSPWA